MEGWRKPFNLEGRKNVTEPGHQKLDTVVLNYITKEVFLYVRNIVSIKLYTLIFCTNFQDYDNVCTGTFCHSVIYLIQESTFLCSDLSTMILPVSAHPHYAMAPSPITYHRIILLAMITSTTLSRDSLPPSPHHLPRGRTTTAQSFHVQDDKLRHKGTYRVLLSMSNTEQSRYDLGIPVVGKENLVPPWLMVMIGGLQAGDLWRIWGWALDGFPSSRRDYIRSVKAA